VFLVLSRGAKSIRRPATLAAWLHRTARQVALKYRLSEARRRQREARSLLAAPPRVVKDPLDELSVRELVMIFDEEVQRLPERFRLPLILCCLEGCTQEEAARRLGWTPGSVKGRLERGRQCLHARLVRRGVSLSAAMVALEALRGGAPAAGTTAAFVTATTRAALLFAAGPNTAECSVAREVAAMAETWIQSTTIHRMKLVLALLLLAGVLTAGIAAVAPPQPDGKPPAEKAARGEEKEADRPRVFLDRHGDPLPAGAVARLGTIRWRTDGEIEALTFAPDGKTVIAGTRSGIYLFDQGGKPLKHIQTLHVGFHAFSFSPDGRRVAGRIHEREGDRFLWNGKEVQVWDTVTGRKTQRYKVERRAMLLWPAEGELMSARTDRGTLVFRDLATGKERRGEMKDDRLPDMDLQWGSFAFSPRAKLLALPFNGTLHIWDVSTGKKRWTLKPKERFGFRLGLSPDGRWLAYLSKSGPRDDKRRIQLWDLTTSKATHTVTATVAPWGTIDFSFSPDSKKLIAFGGSELLFYEVSSGRECARSQNPMAVRICMCAFSRDGKSLATVGFQNTTIQLWDVATTTPKPAFAGHVDTPSKIDFFPDGRRVLSAGFLSGRQKLWQLQTGKPLPLVPDELIDSFTFATDGRMVFYLREDPKDKATAQSECSLRFADAATGRVVHTVKVGEPAPRGDDFLQWSDLRLSSDGKTLLAGGLCSTNEGNPRLFIGWDVATRKQLFRRLGLPMSWEALSPDLKWRAFVPQPERIGAERLSVRIENLVTGEPLVTLPNIKGGSRVLTFSPDARLLATDTDTTDPKGQSRWWGPKPDGSTLRLWEVETATEALILPSEDAFGLSVAFSQDRRLLAFAGRSQTIIVWDLWRGKEWQRFSGFDAEAATLAFSPDGKHLVSGLTNSTLLV
jgi:RNA polymerase sigma factor (sigma-70 family)